MLAESARVVSSEPRVARHLRFDLGARPFLVLMELTVACDLACSHCRAAAMCAPAADELKTTEVLAVLDDLAQLGAPRPIVVFSGGDPLRRDDLEELVRYGSARGLRIALSPAGTARATAERFAALRDAGAGVVSLSLDGASAASHDGFRNVDGSFAWTLAASERAQAAGLRLQVNTTVTAHNVGELAQLAARVVGLGANLWSVFFLVPVGRGRSLAALSGETTEEVLWFLADIAGQVPLKTTEAPQFRRVLAQRARGERPRRGELYAQLRREFDALGPGVGSEVSAAGARRSPLAVGDGRGVVFVSHRGEVRPSGFLPLTVGNVREQALSDIYAGAPLLRALRDPESLHGRCGRCQYREVCGGSRAQAYAHGGDALGEDPTCSFSPEHDSANGAERQHEDVVSHAYPLR